MPATKAHLLFSLNYIGIMTSISLLSLINNEFCNFLIGLWILLYFDFV